MLRICLALCLLATPLHAQITNLDMWGLINVLYIRADTNMNMQITEPEFGGIYSIMDANNDSKVMEPEFSAVWKGLTQYSDEHVHAYFRLADTDRNGEVDKADYDRVYQIFDADGDGSVSAMEFSDEWQEIFHRIPFVVLFERTDQANGKNSRLNKDQMSKMFASFTVEADGSITKANFVKDWESNRFGTAHDAGYIFASLDADQDARVAVAEVGAHFDTLDKSGDGLIEISEVEIMGDAVPIV